MVSVLFLQESYILQKKQSHIKDFVMVEACVGACRLCICAACDSKKSELIYLTIVYLLICDTQCL